MLYFKFDGQGSWEACSEYDRTMMWRIDVCDDGTFAVSFSDPMFQKFNGQCLDTLGQAKSFCDTKEKEYASQAKEQSGPT